MILQCSVSFQVDILVNNGARGQLGLIRKTSLEVDRAILDLNTVGTISLTKAILPHMIERREGQIVIVSSLSGKIGNVPISLYTVTILTRDQKLTAILLETKVA